MAVGKSYLAGVEAAEKAAAKLAGTVVVEPDLRPQHLVVQYKDFEKYKAINRNQKSILTGTRVLFTPDYVMLLELALLRDDMHLLGKEQQTHFKKYCTEANTMLSDEMKQFDEFLGSYKEEIING